MLDRIRQALRRRPDTAAGIPITGRRQSGGGRRMLTADQVTKIRIEVAAGKSQRKVAADYGISQPAVYQIINRISYKDIP